MDYQRIFILLGLAVTSYLLILAWNEDYGNAQKSNNAAKRSGSSSQEVLEETPRLESLSDEDQIPRITDQGVRTENREKIVKSLRPSINISTDLFDLKIALDGGDITSVALREYPTDLDDPENPFLLVDPRNSYVAQTGLIGQDGTDKKAERPTFKSAKADYAMGSADELVVELFYTQESGTEIKKVFKFRRGDYLANISYEISNNSEEDWVGAMYAQIKRDGKVPAGFEGNFMGMQPFVGAATRTQDQIFEKIEFDDLNEAPFRLTRSEGYMAMVQHYFITAWAPTEKTTLQNYYARRLGSSDVYLMGLTTQPITIVPEDQQKISISFYAGPKNQYRLQEIATGLDLTVDYGFLWWLSQPLFYLLTYVHGLVGNWGLAIIGLTLIVKLILWPLSASGYRSMAKMRKLSPEMARLKERYGDDKQAFSQAMMELYKKEGTNPLGGCLPILLQMPVFLALYWTLMESVELRQAPFFLWIRDLSVMDPFFVLPILMGVSMYLTQRMQPEPPDPVQAAVFKYMPIVFTFLFLWFPSGLVLYWLVNNILSIFQQWFVTRQLEKSG
ncbi:MAG: membrane protein insertase YidC [Gammaproteobacteria bacterium]|nr:membrane protein insertase YidC [Gammaproteobacteria bacterium]